MENNNEGGLPAPAAQAATGTEKESMSISDYAALLAKPATEVVEKPDETVAEVATEEVPAEPTPVEGEQTEGNEQPEEQPETEDEKVLSQLTPKTLEKFQKRTDQLTARAKSAEEQASILEAKVKELEAKVAQPPPAPEPEVVVAGIDQSDLTIKATNNAALDKLQQDANAVLSLYENHEDSITRAIARDEDTVNIGGQDMKVAELRAMKKEATKHITQYIPARRKFIAEKTQFDAEAKKEFPSLFDSRSQEYQDLQAIKRQYPALNSVPGLANWIGYALEGMKVRREKQVAAAKPAAKTAAETPAQSAADTGSAAPAKSRTQGGGSEVVKLKADLVKAEKEMDRTGSKEAYQNLLKIQSRLKQLQ